VARRLVKWSCGGGGAGGGSERAGEKRGVGKGAARRE